MKRVGSVISCSEWNIFSSHSEQFLKSLAPVPPPHPRRHRFHKPILNFLSVTITVQAPRSLTLALAWRTHTREVFQALFAQGYSVTDFVRAEYAGRDRAFYVLSADYTADFLTDDTQDKGTWKNPAKPLVF